MSPGPSLTPEDAPVSSACEVKVSSDGPDWSAYLARHGEAGIYHDPRWGRIMQECYGNRPFYLTARRDEAIVGVLQLIWQKSMLFGSHFCSLPYFDAVGVLADDAEAEADLLAAAGQLVRQHKADWAEIRQLRSLGESLPARRDKVTLHLALPDESEKLWKDLKAKVRNQVRKAEKAEVTAEVGGAELLREFHEVYCRNMRDLGSPPHGRRFFRLLADAFGDSVRFFIARQGGRTVAASLTLTDKHGAHVPWAGSDWRARESCPTMILYWRMLAHYCDGGAGRFDFGRSTPDEGTYRFKTQWGAEPVPLYWHFLLPEGGSMPDLRPDSPKYRFLVACWKRLPVGIARAMGPGIIGKLP